MPGDPAVPHLPAPRWARIAMSPTEPKPSLEEVARRLVEAGRHGALGTLDERGGPFVSLAAYATDAEGRPVMLLSRLPEHTKNLARSPEASLLVTEALAPEPLAAARVTLVGAVRAATASERAELEPRYLARHPDAAAWVGFADFAFFVLEVRASRVVEGFGRMKWIEAPK